MIKALSLSLLSLSVSVNAACDNGCSGHGTCSIDDVCSCYDNWGIGLSMDSGDCSDRICPFELAWVDTPNGEGKYHRYTECAGRGICNRGNGLCECFEGYEGEACSRTSCPNSCSGHGTCEYIEDMRFMSTHADYNPSDFVSDAVAFSFPWWDMTKTRGCVCDAQYTDVDCSKRMCPYGTDILAAREDLTVDQKYHVQKLIFEPELNDLTRLNGKTFALTFISRLNETFTTYPIVFDSVGSLADMANDVKLALLHLPNQVIDACTVTAVSTGTTIELSVTFTGPAVQGPQRSLIVEDYECSSGCTPRITGLGLDTVGTRSSYSVTQLAIYNSYECGRRGKCDYDSGLCQCFEGYTGENCNTQTTLV